MARSIFVGNIKADVISDDELEAILRTPGHLRRWHRVTDADGKKCSFGFAEYEDVPSLETAVEILKDVRIPPKKGHGDGKEGDQDVVSEKRKLLVRHLFSLC